MRYAFAGDRNISCNILKFMMDKGYRPLALLVSSNLRSSHHQELIEISNLGEEFIFRGDSFQKPQNVEILKKLNLDYIFGIHFPYIIPKVVLEIPNIGFLNLHPAFLPFNKGWHTPSWAIVDKTPYGATLHYMTEALDEGDIIHQRKLEVLPIDTANSLYKRVLKLEEEVFYEAFKGISMKMPNKFPQKSKGTAHNKKDLKNIQEINLDEKIMPLDLIDKIRALTTNQTSELAYFRADGRLIGIKVELLDLTEEITP